MQVVVVEEAAELSNARVQEGNCRKSFVVVIETEVYVNVVYQNSACVERVHNFLDEFAEVFFRTANVVRVFAVDFEDGAFRPLFREKRGNFLRACRPH